MTPKEILQSAKTVLVVDWPTRDIPESLARAGFDVIVRGGPGPDDYSAYELKEDAVVARHTGCAPVRAELIYSYRPLTELPGLIFTAKSLNAVAIWFQSGLLPTGEKDPKGCWLSPEDLAASRARVEAAGLTFVHEPYIGDVAREFQPV